MKVRMAAGRINTRGHLMRVAVVVLLVAAMMPVVASTSYASWIPRTLHEVIRAGAGSQPGSGILQRALPFTPTDLGVTWQGSESPPRIRTSTDGIRWSGWTQVTGSDDMFDSETGTHYSNLLPGAGARWAQILPGPGANPGSVAIAVINTRDGPLRAVRLTRTAAAAPAQPAIIGRRAWGADESIRKGTPSFTTVKRIFVHHTVSPNNANPASTMRAIYAYHVQVRGWDDIGYNFLVDSRGNTYEGRYSRSYGSSEQPSGEDSGGRGVVGAHTEGHNHGSTGIALLGNAQTQAPTQAAVDALVNVIAWKAGRHNIDPMGGGSSPNVAGHRDASGASTECPGARLHPMLPSIRERAKQIIGASGGAQGGPVGEAIRPILNTPAPGLGDSVAGILRGIGL